MGEKERQRVLEFNKELDSYIAVRKKSVFSFKEFFKKKEEQKVEIPSQLAPYSETGEESLKEKLPEELPAGKQETLADEYEAEKECWLTGFLARIGLAKKAEEKAEKSEEPESKFIADMKEVARISLGVIKKLPPEEIKDFKQSNDFARFRDILKKHSLIK